MEAVKACGGLPLTLAVAGGILYEQFGGIMSAEFVALIKEDHGEMLRKGEFGDEHVAIEDRLITASLRNYVSAERDNVMIAGRVESALCCLHDCTHR